MSHLGGSSRPHPRGVHSGRIERHRDRNGRIALRSEPVIINHYHGPVFNGPVHIQHSQPSASAATTATIHTQEEDDTEREARQQKRLIRKWHKKLDATNKYTLKDANEALEAMGIDRFRKALGGIHNESDLKHFYNDATSHCKSRIKKVILREATKGAGSDFLRAYVFAGRLFAQKSSIPADKNYERFSKVTDVASEVAETIYMTQQTGNRKLFYNKISKWVQYNQHHHNLETGEAKVNDYASDRFGTHSRPDQLQKKQEMLKTAQKVRELTERMIDNPAYLERALKDMMKGKLRKYFNMLLKHMTLSKKKRMKI